MNTIHSLTRRRVLQGGAASAVALCAGVHAQTWPNKPIRAIVAYPAGGQVDQYARLYGDFIQQQTGQPWIVENRTGAGGALGAVEVKRAAADGHTLLFTNSASMITNRVLYKSLPYDSEKDFALVSVMPGGGLPLLGASRTGAANLKEFIEMARRTGKASIGTYARGSTAHIIVAELNKLYGLDIVAVHYRGEAPMFTDLSAETVDGAIGSALPALNVIQTGKARAIAITRKRNTKLPGVATFMEQGVTSRAFDLTGFVGCAAPAGTPRPVLNRLSELIVAAGKSDKVQAMLASYGLDEAAMPIDASQRLYDAEAPVWIESVKGLNLIPE